MKDIILNDKQHQITILRGKFTYPPTCGKGANLDLAAVSYIFVNDLQCLLSFLGSFRHIY